MTASTFCMTIYEHMLAISCQLCHVCESESLLECILNANQWDLADVVSVRLDSLSSFSPGRGRQRSLIYAAQGEISSWEEGINPRQKMGWVFLTSIIGQQQNYFNSDHEWISEIRKWQMAKGEDALEMNPSLKIDCPPWAKLSCVSSLPEFLHLLWDITTKI